ncbi:MAG: sodium-dependent transporter [Lachnospiraceae bacterium]|jgi:NSS family neurotransmitter:Na+ symporter|nr:sodium-dependent transporter [Lachnospiraceae bacterium]
MEQGKGQFNSNFGFLMAALGSAVGLGNLWSFPYKMGLGGGFAFLVIYLILLVTVGYPLLLAEIAVGRKSQKAAIEAYSDVNRKFKFNGVLQTAVPFFLIAFYCTFGGYILKYLVYSVMAFGGKSVDPEAFFKSSLLANGGEAMIWMAVFLVLTVVIVIGGVSGGIEKFCKIAMPALFVMLVVIVVRACTLSGAGDGLAFLFKPHFEGMDSVGDFFSTLKLAGGQMFFSLSLASGCLIAYGSYLGKNENLEKDAAVIAIGDSLVAILAGMAIMPACSAFGIEPGAGPGLLFMSMQTVFNSMAGGKIFGFLFWLLVFFAALSSSIGMMEGGVSAILDNRIKAGKPANRLAVTVLMGVWALIGNALTTLDCLGAAKTVSWFHILGQPDVLDVWDAVAEGVLMPLTGLIMAILLGWVVPHYIDDEVERGSGFKSRGLFKFCIRYLGPIFMILIVYGQLTSFWG